MCTHNEIPSGFISIIMVPTIPRELSTTRTPGNQSSAIQIQWFQLTNCYHPIHNQLKDRVVGKLSLMRAMQVAQQKQDVHLTAFGVCEILLSSILTVFSMSVMWLTRRRKYNKQQFKVADIPASKALVLSYLATCA